MVWVDAENPDPDAIDRAVEVLRRGDLVAIPTETVYGLAANALNESAVSGIFRAKGRPQHNPLIVHVLDVDAAKGLASAWPLEAVSLTQRYWPGPLTLVLPRTDAVPDIVTGGGDTVAIRSPSHPVPRALLQHTGFPIAAPSANLSEQISPTTARHVLLGLDGRISLILDAGPTSGGIESTVISLIDGEPTLLRPGLITPAQIESVIGPIRRSPPVSNTAPISAAPSPGMMPRHYAPRAQLIISATPHVTVCSINSSGKRIGLLIWSIVELAGSELLPADKHIEVRRLPDTASGYAAGLYAALHELDAAGVALIVAEEPPDGDEWLAIRDRLSRASAD